MHQSHQSSSGVISGSSSVADRPNSHRASAIETFGLANGNPNSVSSGVFFNAYQSSNDYTTTQSQSSKSYPTNPPSTSNCVSNAVAALTINERVAEQIHDEIQRFESVHPCIYTIYSLIESISNYNLQQQIREQVIQIEDAFVNSEEWTLSRSVHKIKMGVVGSLDSGKTSLVHYYLTGKPTKELTPEGGRFKSEIVVDGKSYMLLIRDEGEFSPEVQFTRWIDGVMIAFSLENRNSYLIALQYFKRMASHRNMNDIPVFLVGILDSPDESRREISVDEARKTSSTMKMSSYVEWHSAYGMDVRKIFVSACQRILQHNRRLNRATTVSGGDNASSHCVNVGGNKCGSANVANLVNNNSAYQDHRQQFCAPNTFGTTSGTDRNYHHQRSVSAVPINENQSSISHKQNQQYVQSSYQQHHRQQSPPSAKGSSAAVLRRSHQPAAINTAGRPSGSLANVPASCTSSASTFYQELEQLPRSDSFSATHSGGSHQQLPPQLPQHGANCGNGFRYDNTLGRASVADYHRNCPTFMLPTGGQSVQSLAPSNQQRFNDRMSSNMEFAGGATSTGGTMSPAFSHNSLSFQYSGSNSVCPSYSRSTSNVGGSNSASSTTANRRKIPEDMVLFNHSAAGSGGGAVNNYRFNANYYQGHPSGIVSTTALLGGLGGDASTDNCHFGNTAATASVSQILPTPSSTPNTQRKNRRISNIFRTGKDSLGGNSGKDHGSGGAAHFNEYSADPTSNSGTLLSMGVGREIPIREGVLYKRSNKALNREWKKKYVCLYADGRLRYHQNHKEYRHDSGAKELYLGLATVRVSGRKVPRATNRNSLLPQQQQNGGGLSSTTLGGVGSLPMVDDALAENNGGTSTAGDAGTSCNSDGGDGAAALVTSTSSIIGQLHHQELSNNINTPQPMQSAITSSGGGSGGIIKIPSTNIKAKKKRGGHRKPGSGTKHNEDEDDCEFEIISSDQKHWEFSAATAEERDEWVDAIEGLIEKCLQSQLSQKQQNNRVHSDKADVQALKQLPGNDVCADCSTPRPDWASLNLGTLICIECSGIHRNLGSHISRVRSLDLDDWPMENLVVMQAIGNQLANSIWESAASLSEKPGPDSSREQKELWIKKKYEQKEFLPPLDNAVSNSETLTKRLIDAVLERNLPALLTVLPRAGEEDVNGMVNGETDRRTALHLACSIGAAEIVQLLIWHNADIYVLDESHHSALWFARLSGSQECESILLNAGLTVNYGMSPAGNAGGDANTANTNSGKNSSSSSAGSTLISHRATSGNNDDSTMVMPTGTGNDTTIYVGGNISNTEFTSFGGNAYSSLKRGSRISTESVMMPPPSSAAENPHHRRSDFIAPSSPTKFTASTFNPMELSSSQGKTTETAQLRRQSDFVQKRIAGLTVGSGGGNFSASSSQDSGNVTTMNQNGSNAPTKATAPSAFQCLPASVI